MTNINFYQNQEKEDFEMSGLGIGKILGGGTLMAALILFLVGGAYAGLKFYNQNLEQKKNDTNKSIEEKMKYYGEDGGGNSMAVKIAAFSEKNKIVEENLNNKKKTQEFFEKLEGAMVEGVALNSLDWDCEKKIVKLDAVSGNFYAIARQMLSLKKSKNFKDINLSDKTSKEVDENGNKKVKFSIVSSYIGEQPQCAK